jgi:hypothetical protein
MEATAEHFARMDGAHIDASAEEFLVREDAMAVVEEDRRENFVR